MFDGKLGWPELILILAVVLIIFGAGKLPSVGSALGKSIREFRQASKGDQTDEEKTAEKKALEAKAVKEDKA